jgi:hypothetical protein
MTLAAIRKFGRIADVAAPTLILLASLALVVALAGV